MSGDKYDATIPKMRSDRADNNVVGCFICVFKTIRQSDWGWCDIDMNELYFIEDGTHTVFNEGGTYSVNGGRVVLIDPLGREESFNIANDGNIIYLECIDSSYVFYPYDYSYEQYSQRKQKQEENWVSTVEAIGGGRYFVGTWVGSDSCHDYVVIINDDNTFVIDSDDSYYEDNSYAGLERIQEFEQGWNDQHYNFKDTYQNANIDQTLSDEERFYIPDWGNRDLREISINIYGVMLTKQK